MASSGILYWGTGRAAYNLERSNLAHEELATYLTLSAETYQFFKKVRRDMIDGNGKQTLDLLVAQNSFERLLAGLEAQIADELALPARARENSEELWRLANLTDEIDLALQEVGTAIDMMAQGQRDAAIELLTTTLETRINGRVTEIIDSGLADERAEVAEARVETDLLINSLRATALSSAILALAFTIGAIWFLLRHLRGPLAALGVGTSRIAAGQLDHRIEISGNDEFTDLARRFNKMAADLKGQHESLKSAKSSLERTVAARTAELREANRILKDRAETRRQFFADVGHELRTPLTIIRGEAEVALRSRDHDDVNSYRAALKHVVDVSAQLTTLVNDLFLIARSQAGEVDMRMDVVDLRQLARTVTGDMQVFALEQGARLGCEVPQEQVMVLGDCTRLRQLLMILIDNAIQHSPQGVTVRTCLAASGDTVDLFVRDTGPGVPAGEIKNLFERYYRGNASGKRPAGGTGLGLPIAKTIVVGHGGQINVLSTPGSGTEFHIHLPRLIRQPQVTAAR